MRIVFCGFGRAGFECYNQLVSRGDVTPAEVLVFTHSAKDNEVFLNYLDAVDVEYHLGSINKHADRVAAFKPDFLLSVYYRNIIRNEILELVQGSLNCHPSLLPDYRGCFSGAWAIINGEPKTGITFHKIDPGIDTGNILLQKDVEIRDTDTAFSLYHKLVSHFIKHFESALELLISGDPGQAQSNDETARYYSRAVPFDGVRVAKDMTYVEGQNYFKGMYFPPFANAKFVFDEGEVEIGNLEELETYRDQFLSA
jgi:methionyl-tRNA formyltransferase